MGTPEAKMFENVENADCPFMVHRNLMRMNEERVNLHFRFGISVRFTNVAPSQIQS